MKKENNLQIEKLPTVLIIFGATGDLMESKLLPAIFRMHQKGILPKLFRVIGFSRQNLSDKDYQDWVRKNLPKGAKGLKSFIDLFSYQAGLFEDLGSYKNLGSMLGMVKGRFKTCSDRLFYLAVPPNYYETIFNNLSRSGLAKPCGGEEGWTRILVEKPFGENLEVAKKLDNLLGELFKEVQVFRIDHYMAKETIMNVLVFRFSNVVFENLWNKDFIEKIEIRLLEKGGLEKRRFFYDNLGAFKDVGQNHMLQMLALATMDAPLSMDSELIREKRIEILESLPKMDFEQVKKNTVRGQYEGYANDFSDNSVSKTETYFKIKVQLNYPRWKGVPIYLESGKNLKEDISEIKITFKQNFVCLFCPPGKTAPYANTLSFKIKPKEGIVYSFVAKKPGLKMDILKKDLHFLYEEAYKRTKALSDYERLLIDAFLGDQTLFVSTKEIIFSWDFVDHIVRGWDKNAVPLRIYKPNTSGPKNNL